MKPLNLFYQEPDPDRWFKFDRYPRRLIRRIVRGKQRPGGVMMVAIELMRGLDKLDVPYRFNDFSYIKKHPEEIACIIGKPQLLFEREWKNPIIFGAGVFSHPIECPDIFTLYPSLKKMLVPGEWMREMFEPYYQDKVVAWPVGIDTEKWSPKIKQSPEYDFLIYDKVRWEHVQYERELIDPICQTLNERNLSYQFIRYGSYNPADLVNKVGKSKAVIFLCEHETQGLAYQQILATGTPILAWDRGGFWQDPYYYPHKVKYQPVSSVPYWDDRCGLKFAGIEDFSSQLDTFMARNGAGMFDPSAYITENLTLEKCAASYVSLVNDIEL